MRLRAWLFVVIAALVPGTARSVSVDYLVPVPGPVVRHFEPPPTPYAAGHRGIDLAVPVGTPVVASAAGTVRFAGQVGGQLFVSIDHADGIRTTYSFLSAVFVKRGQGVEQGRQVGLSGAGHAGEQQPLLHFGALRGDDYVDPEALIVQSLRRNLWRAVWLAPVEE